MSSYIFTYVKSDLLNKKIEKDSEGWYKVNLGAVNAFNAHGAFYSQEGVNELIFDKTSRLGQKLEYGYLFGEMEHPVIKPGVSKEEAFSRVIYLEPSRKSHHIKKLELIDTGKPTGKGFAGNIIQIVGWVLPQGPFGPYLKESLDNPEINTAFSIRCLTLDDYVGGVQVRRIKSIITFDWVTEPGITSANKFDSPRVSMESRSNLDSVDMSYSYTGDEIMKMVDDYKKANPNVSMESDLMSCVRDLKLNSKKDSSYDKLFKQW